MASAVELQPPSVTPSDVVSDASSHWAALSISSTISMPHIPSRGVEPMYVPATVQLGAPASACAALHGGGSVPLTWLPSTPTSWLSFGLMALTGLLFESCRRPVKSMLQSAAFQVMNPKMP